MLVSPLKQNVASGFTLLEVMISVAIIAISLVTLLGSQAQSVSVAGEAHFLTTASLLAQKQLGQLERTDFGSIVPDSGDFGEKYPGYSWTVNVRELTEEETDLPGSTGKLKFIELSVLLGDGARYNYTLEYIKK